MVVNLPLWIRFNFWTKKEAELRYYNKQAPLAGAVISDPTITGSTGAWLDIAFVSGWENFLPLTLQPVQYKKVGDLVFLRGICYRTSGSSGTIATLPAGYRPLGKIQMMVLSNAALGYVDIETDGDIVLNAGSPTDWVSLNNIVFSVI